ncbi:MAG: NADPH:quinone oxidoreductase family protein [Acidimicrobiia bacterium]|nr:NADPH:quinone oxidoreductase family protein [Acidimicrobiia bacterium]
MRAVVCQQLGPLSDLVIEDRQALAPGPDEVVVDVHAAGVNYVDGLICQGRYQIKPATPFVPGSEIAGHVTAVGGAVAGVEPGARVIAMTGFGGFADQVAVPGASVVPIPEALTFGQGAALIQSYSTALFTLTHRATVARGEWVLVLGAGGGIGLACIDVAVALGARVIAAASTPDKLEAARAMGAEETVAYEDEDLKTRARELSGGGVDVMIDAVGGSHSEQALRATRWCGRFCVVGFASGTIPSLPLNQVLLNNRTIVGVDWGAWTFRDQEGYRALLGELMAMVDDGRLHPPVPAERPLVEAGKAMEDLIARRVTGKVVLVP